MSVDLSAFTALSRSHREWDVPLLLRDESFVAVKLFNCVLFGVMECTVEMQFGGSRGNLTPYPDDMHERMWCLIRLVMLTLRMSPEEKDMGWTPILYFWEPVSGNATHESEFSRLVVADGSLSHFLLVEVRDRTICPRCEKPETILYDKYLHFSAQRLLHLITYLPLPNKPKWVRATYTTNENATLLPAFCDSRSSTIRSDPKAAVPKPSIFYLSPQDLQPMFTSGDLVCLDYTIIARDIRELVGVKEGNEWITRWSTANKLVGKADPMIKKLCWGCGEYDMADKRLRCTACRMVVYCSAKCQRTHWPEHKHECMPKKKKA